MTMELDPTLAHANLKAFVAQSAEQEFTDYQEVAELIYGQYDVPHSLKAVITGFGRVTKLRHPKHSITHRIADKADGQQFEATLGTYGDFGNTFVQMRSWRWEPSIPVSRKQGYDRVLRLRSSQQLDFSVNDIVDGHYFDHVEDDLTPMIMLSSVEQSHVSPELKLADAQKFGQITANLAGLLVASTEPALVH